MNNDNNTILGFDVNLICDFFLNTEVERISTQHLEETEDLTVHLLDEEEVKALLLNDEVKQSLMAAPFWKYFALYSRL